MTRKADYPATLIAQLAQLAERGGFTIPEPVRELRFAPGRRFRFDLSWNKPHMLAVEINGGNWIRGRHARPAAMKSEYEKARIAQRLGWKILTYEPSSINNYEAAQEIASIIVGKEVRLG